MKTDITFLLTFDPSEKEQVIASLAVFCVNTPSDTFDADLISDDCSVNFVLDREEETNWYYDLYASSRSVPGKVTIGTIQLWIKENRDEIRLEFWAPASSTGKACLDSNNLRNEFIRLLRENKGSSLQLDQSDGFVETLIKL